MRGCASHGAQSAMLWVYRGRTKESRSEAGVYFSTCLLHWASLSLYNDWHKAWGFQQSHFTMCITQLVKYIYIEIGESQSNLDVWQLNSSGERKTACITALLSRLPEERSFGLSSYGRLVGQNSYFILLSPNITTLQVLFSTSSASLEDFTHFSFYPEQQ